MPPAHLREAGSFQCFTNLFQFTDRVSFTNRMIFVLADWIVDRKRIGVVGRDGRGDFEVELVWVPAAVWPADVWLAAVVC